MVTRKPIGSWVRLDVGFHHHPKALAVGPVGRDAFLAAVCWSGRYGQDGRVSPKAWTALSTALGQDPDELGALLLGATLLDDKDDGLVIHDFRDWQQTAEEQAASRQAERARQTAYRARLAAGQNGGAVTRDKRKT